MNHRNRTLVLWLSSCLLAPPGIAAAQMGFLAAVSRPSNTVAETAKADATASITIPAGTHILMKLTSPLHTTSATSGSGVYLETSSPVIVDNRLAIPRKTRVFGFVESDRRPGRTHGRAHLRLRFTQFILPDDRMYEISGNLQSLPGSREHRTTNEGTIEPVDQIDGDVYLVAKTAGVGLLFGSVHHIGIGIGPGAAIGFGLGLAKVLFTRGDPIHLPVGTTIEMVLQHELVIATPSIEEHHDSANHDATDKETAPQNSALDNPARLSRNGTNGRCPICE